MISDSRSDSSLGRPRATIVILGLLFATCALLATAHPVYAVVTVLPDQTPAPKGTAKPKAPEKPNPKKAAPTANPFINQVRPIHCQVVAIDAATSSFTASSVYGGAKKYLVTPATSIKNGRSAASFSSIKVGDWISGIGITKSDSAIELTKVTGIAKAGAR